MKKLTIKDAYGAIIGVWRFTPRAKYFSIHLENPLSIYLSDVIIETEETKETAHLKGGRQ